MGSRVLFRVTQPTQQTSSKELASKREQGIEGSENTGTKSRLIDETSCNEANGGHHQGSGSWR